ncbi:hypothetical protein [Streptomyces natalensis]|uniref:Uncharacterized protein n=1 Tax=Streptomyces natalensis ATCC 27448 TaxID=1240678 RepID=A0A0D7CMP7_9ACTN|nr:hypothetical protein [Streptomyces natalensis]KIZ17336.1 hypothetical protein SNA_15060 [Streptomyces natalensis ATCC 27448]
MKQSQKILMARGALAALSVATIAAAVLLFVRPQSSAAPTIALLAVTVALTAASRSAGWLGSSSRRNGNSA